MGLEKRSYQLSAFSFQLKTKNRNNFWDGVSPASRNSHALIQNIFLKS